MKTQRESLVSSLCSMLGIAYSACVLLSVYFFHALSGQFFSRGVEIDEDAKLLRIPGRSPVPVVKQDLWKFMEQDLKSDSHCWTSVYHSSQGAGIIAGTYKDYIVDDLLAVGF